MNLDNFLWAMVVCFIVSIIIRLWYGSKLLRAMSNHEKLEHLKKIIHDVNVERKEDIEYWFDKETDQFLAQGNTLEEIVTTLKSRFPDHVFLVQGRGGVAAKTGWKLLGDAEFTKSMLGDNNVITR